MIKIKNFTIIILVCLVSFSLQLIAAAKREAKAQKSQKDDILKHLPTFEDVRKEKFWDNFWANNGLVPKTKKSVLSLMFNRIFALPQDLGRESSLRDILCVMLKRIVKFSDLGKRKQVLMVVDDDDQTLLSQAILIGDLEIVKLLCKFSGLSINQLMRQSKQGLSPLHTAILYDQIEILKFLVNEQHFPLNQQALHGLTPLNFAVSQMKENAVKILLDAGADLEIRSTFTFRGTPLLMAVANGNIQILKMLALYGANLSVCNATGKSVLSVACAAKNPKMVEFLMRFGGHLAHLDEGSIAAMNSSAKITNNIVRRLFIDAGLLRVGDPLLSALAAGEDVVSLLTEKYKSFPDKLHPVHMAVMSKACRCLELVLIENEPVATLVSPDGSKTPLSMALTALSQDEGACACLDETGVCVGPARMVYLLLEHGAQVHLAHPSVRTVLDENLRLNSLLEKVQQSITDFQQYFTERDASMRMRAEHLEFKQRCLDLEIAKIIAQEKAQIKASVDAKKVGGKKQRALPVAADDQAGAAQGDYSDRVPRQIDAAVMALEDLVVEAGGAADGDLAQLRADESPVRLFLRRQAPPVNMQVLSDTFGNGGSIRFVGASSRYSMHMAKQEAVLEKSFAEATDGFEVVDTKRKCCLSIADNLEPCLVKNIREKQVVIDVNVLDHAWTEELLLRVLTCGSVYLEKQVDGESVCLLVVAQVNRTLPADFGVAWDSRPRFITLCFDLDDDGEIGECFHCCSQWHHPYDVRLSDGRKKYHLVPVDACACIDARGKLLLEGAEGFMETYKSFAR